jgi:MFS transporter, DHA2 family, triacylglyceride efflux pump
VTEPTRAVGAAPRVLLALAAVAVAFAAADTYVVVLALPDLMQSVDIDVSELQKAAPIISGFLLGYVGILPLTGRIADLRGRIPVLVGSLVVFAIGSVITAAAYDLDSMVVGRFLQGAGGGGLVPATLALVADLWPAHRRGVPLGVVGAVQELGSVLGPLYGALVLAVADWRAIFWINMAVGLVLAAAIVTTRRGDDPATTAAATEAERRRPDLIGAGLFVLALIAVVVLMLEPESLVTDIDYGRAFIPVTGDSRWLTPLALVAYGLLALFVLRQATARRPLVDWRTWGEIRRRADLPGALLLAGALAGIILAFATADPQVQVFSPAGPYLLAGSVVCAGLFAWRQARAPEPLIPRGALRAAPAWGAVLVSGLVGAALIAALVDIPLFARLTVYPDSQLDAALVLVRFLAALPVGALVGGWLTHRVAAGQLTAGAMLLAAAGFGWMSTWGATSLEHPTATVPLVLTGFGFGAAIAPINAALLASTDSSVHGLASALVVVARMVGMLIGISALTTIGLRRFYAVSDDIPSTTVLCPANPTDCDVYEDRLLDAGLAQLEAVFLGAAVCAVLAALAALPTLRGAATREVTTGSALRPAG